MAKNPHNRIARVAIDRVTFGVEIECFLPDTVAQTLNLQLGPRHHGRPLPAPFPADWYAEEDASPRLPLSTFDPHPARRLPPTLPPRGHF